MKDKTNNTSAFSIFGAAAATSANGNGSKTNSKVTSTVDITVDIAGLVAKGKELLEDETLNISSGKIKSFRALGKELLKDKPNLSEEFEKTTNLSGVFKFINSDAPEIGQKTNEELSHKYAHEAVQRGIDFLVMLS
jgi:hypothetical protein